MRVSSSPVLSAMRFSTMDRFWRVRGQRDGRTLPGQKDDAWKLFAFFYTRLNSKYLSGSRESRVKRPELLRKEEEGENAR